MTPNPVPRLATPAARTALLAASLWGAAAFAGSPQLSSGRYEGGLTLAVAPLDQHRLTGHLAVPGTPCRLYLHGLPHGEIFRVAVLAPGAQGFVGYGELRIRLDGPQPRVQLDAPVPSHCQKPLAGLAQRWWTLGEAQEWTGVRLVQAARASFHQEPHESTVRKAYVVQWDAVAIDRETPAFARALYLGGRGTVSGWLRQEDLFETDPTPEMAYVRDHLPPMEGQWPQTPLPIAVRAYLNVRERCEHFEGEEITDEARGRFLQAAVKRECADATARHQSLLTAYAGQKPQIAFLQRNAPPP